MSRTHRVKRQLAFAGVAALLAAGFTVPSVAFAADGDSERGFPELIREWYVTAPAVPYALAAPAPTVDESLKSKGFKIAFFRPDGGAPSNGQGDLELSYVHPSSAAAVDEIRFQFFDFQTLSSELGTTIVDALFLPIPDASATETIVNEVAQNGGVYFSDSSLVINRQAEPCAVKKLQPTYEFQVALLGSNGHKYLADVAVNLGKRPQSACATENKPKPTSPSTGPAPVADTEETEEVEEKSEVETEASTDVAAPESEGADWGFILTALALVVGLTVAIVVTHRRKTSPTFKDDGSLVSSGHKFSFDDQPEDER